MSFSALQLRLLRRRIRALQAENSRLRRRLEEIDRTAHTNRGDDTTDEIRTRLHAVADDERSLSLRHYPAYLLARLRATSLWVHWQRVLRAFRRWRIFTATIRVLLIAFTWLETGAFFLVYAAVVLLALPLLLLSGAILLTVGLLEHRQYNARLARQLADKHVYLFFPDSRTLKASHDYLCGMVRDFAARPDTAVIVVSPYFWSGRGLADRRPYVTLRCEAVGDVCLYLVRRHYYFSLRRHVLRNGPACVALIF
ncbi:MAG: hypothetical protein IKL84_02970 [Clostridia bacterium]|nr:hypothetical protein [Clostridia bacterium]